MRVDSLIALPTKAEFWDFLETQDADTGEIIRTYSKSADIKVSLTADEAGYVVFVRERLSFNGQLRNIRDNRNSIILDAGDNNIYTLGASTAQLDVFGNIMGYKHRITPGAGAF